MSSTAVSVGTQHIPSAALRRFAWAVLAYFIAVILWGALVRATGSGAGCGEHWPLCNGTVVQHSPRVDTIIEFTHRVTSGISFFSAVGLLVWTFAGTVRGHLARAASVARRRRPQISISNERSWTPAVPKLRFCEATTRSGSGVAPSRDSRLISTAPPAPKLGYWFDCVTPSRARACSTRAAAIRRS